MSKALQPLEERLAASGLVGPEQLRQCRSALPQDADETALLEYLAEQKILTSWQAGQLKAGRSKGFLLGPL